MINVIFIQHKETVKHYILHIKTAISQKAIDVFPLGNIIFIWWGSMNLADLLPLRISIAPRHPEFSFEIHRNSLPRENTLSFTSTLLTMAHVFPLVPSPRLVDPRFYLVLEKWKRWTLGRRPWIMNDPLFPKSSSLLAAGLEGRYVNVEKREERRKGLLLDKCHY